MADRRLRLLDEPTVRSLMSAAEALEAVREAFISLDAGHVSLPAILDLEFPEHLGEAHVKGAHIHGSPTWSVKLVTGFYDNHKLELPNNQGMSVVASAEDGSLRALLLDNGYLTELRTGAAGGLATELLAPEQVEQVLIVGTGGQARYQLESLLLVRRPSSVKVWGRRAEAAQARADDLKRRFGIATSCVTDLEAAVRAADVVITATASRDPLIRADWLSSSTHVTAMGSDFPGKQELFADVMARADVVVADHPPTAAQHGELRAALAAGTIVVDSVAALGALAAGRAAGRTSEEQVTVCDLVGVGVQDAAVASAVVARAEDQDLGSFLT